MPLLWDMPCPTGTPPTVDEEMVRSMRTQKRAYVHYLLSVGASWERISAYSEAWERTYGKVTG